MDMRNCIRCGRLFNYINKPICSDCAIAEEEEFGVVRAYVKENPGANINVVSSQTGVSVKRIMKYLRDGKLEVMEGSAITITCEKCGKPIHSGRFCADCSNRMSDIVSGAVKPQKIVAVDSVKKSSGMHLSKLKD